jgi:hypothetical protein
MIKHLKHSEEGDILPSRWEDTFGRIGIVVDPWEMGGTWIQGDRKVSKGGGQ